MAGHADGCPLKRRHSHVSMKASNSAPQLESRQSRSATAHPAVSLQSTSAAKVEAELPWRWIGPQARAQS